MDKEIKLTPEILQQIKQRQIAIQSINTLSQMARRELKLYTIEQLIALGLDPKKEYKLNDKTGDILEIKAEPIVKEDDVEENKE